MLSPSTCLVTDMMLIEEQVKEFRRRRQREAEQHRQEQVNQEE